ncbi:hypothetical protein [Bacteroides fragilis]|uniref:Uncharacterized protein n=1 Tax=Bacteroides fragilis TaxID=817 RepID=A0AB38PIP5_BACFG|nr:hypothetical protein [Bacteroides fragilis]KAB5385723.1 hypothetical protein F9Z90_24960 [Bacteroides fragilis]TWV35894.1 hypothetical protein FSA06_24940 [Bacteroides fragilis]TWV42728.1 hypothetical protein FSA03_24920 [Bacteroides fragilis]
MNFVIVSIAFCLEHGIIVPAHARKSLDGTQVILHEEYIAPVLQKGDDVRSYRYDSSRLRDILGGPQWTSPQEEVLRTDREQ